MVLAIFCHTLISENKFSNHSKDKNINLLPGCILESLKKYLPKKLRKLLKYVKFP